LLSPPTNSSRIKIFSLKWPPMFTQSNSKLYSRSDRKELSALHVGKRVASDYSRFLVEKALSQLWEDGIFAAKYHIKSQINIIWTHRYLPTPSIISLLYSISA
jgi:hypothetical protein